MTIWSITGVHRVQWRGTVLQNFRHQTYADKRLIVVLNGDCVNMPASAWDSDIVILRCGPDPAWVMNEALEYIRINGSPDDWFCKCDADDYYGPKYLENVAAHTAADFSGIKSCYVKSQDNVLWFAEGNARTAIVHGPTIAGRVGTAIPFRRGMEWGEDTVWCQDMVAKGRECAIRPSDGFCYRRWANYQHTWPCTDEELLAAWPIPMYEIGEYDENVIDGKRKHRYSKALEERKLTVSNAMPVRVLLSRLEKGKPMKKITIPEHSVSAGNGESVELGWFIMFIINNHAEFNRDGAGIRSAMRIEQAVAEASKSKCSTIDLEDADWTRLSQAAESPSCGYPVQPARAALPWIEAIKCAT